MEKIKALLYAFNRLLKRLIPFCNMISHHSFPNKKLVRLNKHKQEHMPSYVWGTLYNAFSPDSVVPPQENLRNYN